MNPLGSLGRDTSSPPRQRPKPEKCNSSERRSVPQEVPPAQPRRCHFYRRRRFSVSCGAIEQHVDAPKLLGIEGHLDDVLYLCAAAIQPRCVTFFWEPAAYRLHADFDLQILRKVRSARRFHHDPKRSRAHIGMRPERNDVRTYVPIHDDRERWPVVRAGGRSCGHKQPESGDVRASLHHYPINVARISIG